MPLRKWPRSTSPSFFNSPPASSNAEARSISFSIPLNKPPTSKPPMLKSTSTPPAAFLFFSFLSMITFSCFFSVIPVKAGRVFQVRIPGQAGNGVACATRVLILDPLLFYRGLCRPVVSHVPGFLVEGADFPQERIHPLIALRQPCLYQPASHLDLGKLLFKPFPFPGKHIQIKIN